MAITILIVGVSLAMFVCWLRSAVALILQTVGQATGANLLQERRQLYDRARAETLPLLCESLRKEFAVLKRLRIAFAHEGGGSAVAERLLMVNFQVMRLCSSAAWRFRPHAARSALAEMSATVEYFASLTSARSLRELAGP